MEVTPIKALGFFRLKGETLQAFAVQLRAMSDQEKLQLASEVCHATGDTLKA